MPQEPESVSLPEPPPPRSAARDAAIGAALRRFDGAGEPVAAARQRIPWNRRPQFQLAIAASLVLVVGLPVALIGLREQGSAPTKVSPAASAPREAGRNPAADVAQPAAGASEQGPRPPLVTAPRQVPAQPPAIALNEAPAPAPAAERDEDYAAAPPPPPPPPPAPAPEMAQKSADAAAGELVVTGTRIPRPSLTSPSPVTVISSSERDQISSAAKRDRSYGAFLRRLQAAVGENDHGAIIGLIRFPLRVNSGGRSQIYPDAKSVRRDFDAIFTPRVRRAILAQQADQLFTRDVGAMIGDGEVWFDHVCSDANCSRLGPVRITAINR